MNKADDRFINLPMVIPLQYTRIQMAGKAVIVRFFKTLIWRRRMHTTLSVTLTTLSINRVR